MAIFDHLPDIGGDTSFQQTSSLIQQCIDHNSLDDAVFISEMLHERVSNDESLLLYTDCLLRLSRTEEVYHLLFTHPKNHPRLRYLFAKCCFDLKKYDQCERVLIENCEVQPIRLHPIFENTLSAPYAGYLLAMVFCQTGRVDLSRNECAKSIETNPFIWSTICKYVQVGGKNVRNLMQEMDVTVQEPVLQTVVVPPKKTTKVEKTVTPASKRTPLISNIVQPKMGAPRKTRPNDRTTVAPEQVRRSLRLHNDTLDMPNENAGRIATRGSTPRGNKSHNVRSAAKSIDTSPAVINRRTRDTKPLGSRSANAMRSLSSSTTSVASSASQTLETLKESENPKKPRELEPVLKDVYNSFQHFAALEEAIGSHQWDKAKKLLGDLPPKIQKQSLSLLMRARVMFEMSDYESTKDILVDLRRQHPHKVEGTELLSTALWQLQDSHALSSLARSMTDNHRRRPQTWCVVGNCFSLQRQHSVAVDCMERAVQLDPHFAYAYTLLGHELVYQEELDKACKAFRSALSISPNDYRAWYGLGQVHQRNEQLHLARSNMKKAVHINPTNRGMLCSLAQVEQALGHPEEAMRLLTQALKLNPNDVACRYNKARLLYDMKKDQECLNELEQLKQLSPDEAHIFHLLGKVHRRLDNTHKALLNYSWAAEMDPRGEQMMANGISDNYSEDSYSPENEERE